MLEKYNSGMGMRVKAYITTAKTVCMRYGRIFAFWNGPLTVTSNKLLLIRNCYKFSFMWQGRNILQPWRTCSRHVLRTNCVFDWLVHNQQTPCRSSYTPWPCFYLYFYSILYNVLWRYSVEKKMVSLAVCKR